VYAIPSRSWLGFRNRSGAIDLELLLQRSDTQRNGVLTITVILRPTDRRIMTLDPSVRDLCTQIFIDLRAYLMGST
jgi:hypothetical protein